MWVATVNSGWPMPRRPSGSLLNGPWQIATERDCSLFARATVFKLQQRFEDSETKVEVFLKWKPIDFYKAYHANTTPAGQSGPIASVRQPFPTTILSFRIQFGVCRNERTRWSAISTTVQNWPWMASQPASQPHTWILSHTQVKWIAQYLYGIWWK